MLLCRQFQTDESLLKQNDILFHPLLILKIPFSKEIFNLNNKFFIVKKKLRSQELANLLLLFLIILGPIRQVAQTETPDSKKLEKECFTQVRLTVVDVEIPYQSVRAKGWMNM